MTKRIVTIKRQPRVRVQVTEMTFYEEFIHGGHDPHEELLRKIEVIASVLDIGTEEAERIVLGKE